MLRATAGQLSKKMRDMMADGKISEAGRIVFVDDGSRDGTWKIIDELCGGDAMFAGVGLSRNRGHQYALFAGLMTVRNEADMVISIDADLQDSIDVFDKMVDEYHGGSDIVYGVRKSRRTDSFFKRISAEGYYKLLSAIGCDIVFNHADYRLMSARALEALSHYDEQGLFLRGLVPMLGYKTSVVEYDRKEREAGRSKYPFKRMMALAFDGVTSLSLRPLRFITAAGVVMLLIAVAMLIFLLAAIIAGRPASDWKIITASIWGVGGLLMLALGIVGEYVGRALTEVKRRPRYNIDRYIALGSPPEDKV